MRDALAPHDVLDDEPLPASAARRVVEELRKAPDQEDLFEHGEIPLHRVVRHPERGAQLRGVQQPTVKMRQHRKSPLNASGRPPLTHASCQPRPYSPLAASAAVSGSSATRRTRPASDSATPRTRPGWAEPSTTKRPFSERFSSTAPRRAANR